MRQNLMYMVYRAIAIIRFLIGKITLEEIKNDDNSSQTKIKALYQLTWVSSNELFEAKTILRSRIKIMDGLRIRLVSMFSPVYIILAGQGDSLKSTLARLYRTGFWLQYYSNGCVKMWVRDNFKYYNLTDGIVSDKILQVKGWEVSKMIKYQFYSYSNSGTRNQSLVFCSNSYKASKVIDRYLCGGLRLAFKSFVGKTAGEVLNKLGKVASRIGMGLAPMKDFCDMANYVIYCGCMTNKDGESFADGFAPTNGTELSFTKGYTHDEFVGSGFQCRPAPSKDLAYNMKGETYRVLLEGLESIIKQKRKMLKERIKNETDKEKREELKKQLANEKLVYVGDKEHSMMLLDQNALKMNFVHKTLKLRILAVAKNSRSICSKQLLKCFFKAALDADREEEGFAVLKSLMEYSVKDAKEQFFGRKPSIMTPEEAQKCLESGYIEGILTKVAPELIYEIPGLYNKQVRMWLDKLTNMVGGCNFQLEAFSERLIPDMTTIFTGWKVDGILKADEVFLNRKNVGRVIIGKYPITLNIEYGSCHNVSIETIVSRCGKLVDNGTISSRESRAIISYFKNLDKALIVLPADMRRCKMLAGSDFDYDGCTVVVETICDEDKINELQKLTNKFVDVMFREHECYVDIQR